VEYKDKKAKDELNRLTDEIEAIAQKMGFFE
jgi:hypothetical protein